MNTIELRVIGSLKTWKARKIGEFEMGQVSLHKKDSATLRNIRKGS